MIFQANGQSSIITTDDLDIKLITEFEWVFDDHNSGASGDISIWKPKAPAGYHILGYTAINRRGGQPQTIAIAVKGLTKGALAYPTDYKWIWNNSGSGSSHDGATVYEPIPPTGYVAMGSVIARSYGKPSLEEVVCIRRDLVVGASINSRIWSDAGSGGELDGSAWTIVPPKQSKHSKVSYITSGSFAFVASHGKPSFSNAAHALKVELPTEKRLIVQQKPRLTSIHKPSQKTTMPVLSSVSYLPCISVFDPYYKGRIKQQIKNTPIYTLERYDFYKMRKHSSTDNPKGSTMNVSFSYGMETSNEKSIETTFETSATAEGGVEMGAYSASVSVTVSFAVSHSESHTITRSSETVYSDEVGVPGNGAAALWSLSHKYILKDKTGRQVKVWVLDTEDTHLTVYPNSSTGKPGNYFEEKFNDNSKNWAIGDFPTYATSISNGKFFMEFKNNTSYIYPALSVPLDTRKDFIISTKMNHVNGITNHGYGFSFGRDAKNNYHSFQISADGHFQVSRMRNNEWQNIQKWTKSKHIITGDNTNILQMEKRGDTMNFYINGYFVHKMSFEAFAGDYLGFIINHKQKVSVNELTVMYL